MAAEAVLRMNPFRARRSTGPGKITYMDAACRTAKLFTSANLSNHRMQRLLRRAGWRAAGMVHGLDDGDPEIFYLCPRDPDPS